MKYISFIIFGIIIIIGSFSINILKEKAINKSNEKIHNEYIERLKDSFNIIKFKYDSIIMFKQKTIDSLLNVKQTTITIYDKAEIDFSDSNIVDDDSVIRYIAKKIQD